MALKLVLAKYHDQGHPDLTEPRFFCDVCGGMIEDAEGGLYLWNGPDGYGPEHAVRMTFVHQGECDRQVRRFYRSNMPLSAMLVYLTENSLPDKDFAEVRERIKRLP